MQTNHLSTNTHTRTHTPARLSNSSQRPMSSNSCALTVSDLLVVRWCKFVRT